MREWPGYYILDEDHRVVPATPKEWAPFFEDFEKNRRVAETFTRFYRISTVFLGLDHQHGNGPPLVFETMAFERESYEVTIGDQTIDVHEDIDTQRYSSWDDAITGHKAMVRRIQKMETDAAGAVTKAKREVKHD